MKYIALIIAGFVMVGCADPVNSAENAAEQYDIEKLNTWDVTFSTSPAGELYVEQGWYGGHTLDNGQGVVEIVYDEIQAIDGIIVIFFRVEDEDVLELSISFSGNGPFLHLVRPADYRDWTTTRHNTAFNIVDGPEGAYLSDSSIAIPMLDEYK